MMSTKKYRISTDYRRTTGTQRLGQSWRSGCGVQTDPCAHSADER